jgi:hypothetical protein
MKNLLRSHRFRSGITQNEVDAVTAWKRSPDYAALMLAARDFPEDVIEAAYIKGRLHGMQRAKDIMEGKDYDTGPEL